MSEAQTVKPFRTIGIVGAGISGTGLTHRFALSGFGVILCDTNKEAIRRGVAEIRELFAKDVQQGTLSAAEAHKLTGGIGITTGLEDFEICDMVIESINEDLAAKQAVFAELSARVDPDCVLATNSATLALADIVANVAEKSRTVNLRFACPLERQSPVEVEVVPQTSRTTIDRVLALAKKLELVPVIR